MHVEPVDLACGNMARSGPGSRPGPDPGGRNPDRARVVFNLEKLIMPRVSQENQTVIVKFPDKIGEPLTLPESFIIQGIVFDGNTAVISIKHPFTFTSNATQKPARYTLDITAKKTRAAVCPIGNVLTTPNKTGMTIDVFVQEGMWPDVLYSKNKRLFLVFKGEINCDGIAATLSKTPYLGYSGTIKIGGGAAALAIDLKGEKAEIEVTPHAPENKVSIEINTSGGLKRSNVYDFARNAFEQGDIASTIHTLLPYARNLDARENILLGKAYWKIAYPYFMKSYSMKALKNMSEGVKAHPPGLKAEEVILEYTHMLKAAGMYDEAMNYITFLEGSISAEIIAEAYLIDIDILNSRKQFQDAYVQNRRMLNALDKDGIPPRLMPYYNMVLGDTYLVSGQRPRPWSSTGRPWQATLPCSGPNRPSTRRWPRPPTSSSTTQSPRSTRCSPST
jgi:hypothetical protein